jgi:hypothetical protein
MNLTERGPAAKARACSAGRKAVIGGPVHSRLAILVAGRSRQLGLPTAAESAVELHKGERFALLGAHEVQLRCVEV